MEYTLALIKPDAVGAGKAAEIQQLAELAGFSIIAKRSMQLTQHQAEEFYAEHQGKSFYAALVEFMTSGPLVAMVLAKGGAIAAWREAMGPTDVFEARVRAPKCMRALYGTNGTRNATHGSDSPASAAREVKLLFPGLQLTTPADPAADQDCIVARLQPTLLQGLTALAKEKPSSQPAEAATFLARWLLAHNPAKPQVAAPHALQQQVEAQLAAAEAAAAAAQAAALARKQAACAGSSSNGGRAAGKLQALGGGVAAASEAEAQQAAATRVQACVRGHQARQQVAAAKAAGVAGN